MSDKLGFTEVLRRVRRALSRADQKRAALLLVLTLIETLSDVVGLAMIPPLVYLVSDLSIIQRSPVLRGLQSTLGVDDAHSFVLILVGVVLLTFAFRHVFGVWVVRRQHQFATGVALNLTRWRFRKYLDMPYEAFKKIPSSEAIRDIAMMPAEFATNVLIPTSVILTEGAIVAWILVGILLFDPRLMALMAIVVLPPILVSRVLIRGRARRLGQARISARSEGYRVLSQALFGFPYLRLWGKGKHFVDKSVGAFREFYRTETDLAVLSHVPRRLVEMSAVLGIGVLIAYAMLFGSGNAEIITLLAFVAAAAYRLMPSLTRILMALTTLRSATYVFDILTPESEPEELPRDSVQGASMHQSLSFENVSFSYQGVQSFALKDVSFRILKGERVGFVGPSGSGKTTLMNLVLRFIREQEGRVCRDGAPLGSLDDREWQRQLGYVQQDPYLLDGTLAENVAFGEDVGAIDRARVQSALKASSLQGLLEMLPQGVDAQVGEFGGTLSGGQRQRIAIARALYRNAEILVLDEATSALDAGTEWEVTKTLRELSADRAKTLLIIAHRGAMLSICDRVYRLDRGRIVETLESEAIERWRSESDQPQTP